MEGRTFRRDDETSQPRCGSPGASGLCRSLTRPPVRVGCGALSSATRLAQRRADTVPCDHVHSTRRNIRLSSGSAKVNLSEETDH